MKLIDDIFVKVHWLMVIYYLYVFVSLTFFDMWQQAWEELDQTLNLIVLPMANPNLNTFWDFIIFVHYAPCYRKE